MNGAFSFVGVLAPRTSRANVRNDVERLGLWAQILKFRLLGHGHVVSWSRTEGLHIEQRIISSRVRTFKASILICRPTKVCLRTSLKKKSSS